MSTMFCTGVHVPALLSRAVKEGLAEKVTVNRDPKESRESSADFWGKGFQAEGTGEEKVLKQEHFGVLKERRETSGVEKEKRSEREVGSRNEEAVM